jgi:RNA polymerase sigma-70 factor (ECF subfamily)
MSGAGERELVRRFVDAFTADDTDALLALMSDDIWVRMPPLPFEYRGLEAARRFFAAVGAHRRRIERMGPVGVNRQSGWGEYVRDAQTGALRLAGVVVVDVSGGRICEVTHFETTVAPHLGLPRSLRAD